MNENSKSQLITMIRSEGTAVLDNTQRCEGLLRDYCSGNSPELNLFLQALRARVPANLVANGGRDTGLVARLARGLEDEHGLAAAPALWAVMAWADALAPASALSDGPGTPPEYHVLVPSQPPTGSQSSPLRTSQPPTGSSALARTLHRARQLNDTNGIDDAIALLWRAVGPTNGDAAIDEFDPAHDEVVYLLVSLLAELGRFKEAHAMCEIAIERRETALILAAYAQLWNTQEDGDLGWEYANRACQLDPTCARAWVALAGCIGDSDDAAKREAVQRAKTCGRLDVETEALIALYDLTLNKENEGIAQLRRRAPRNRAVQVCSAAALVLGGLPQEGVRELEAILARDARLWVVGGILAYFQFAMGDFEAAATTADHALAVNPRSKWARLTRIKLAGITADRSVTLAALAALRRDRPRDGELCEPLTGLFAACGDFKSAFNEARLARATQPSKFEAHMLLPAISEAIAEYAVAIEQVDVILNTWPDRSAARCLRARCLLKLGRILEATQSLNSLADDEENRFVFASLFSAQADWPRLEAHASRWLKLAAVGDSDEGVHSLRYYYVLALARQGKARQLRAWLNDINTSNLGFFVLLAQAYAAAKDAAGLDGVLNDTRLRGCLDWEILDGALCAAQAGQAPEAAVWYAKRLVELGPSDASRAGNLAKAYWNAGQTVAAIAEYRRALELDPSLTSAANELACCLGANNGDATEIKTLLERAAGDLNPLHLANLMTFELNISCGWARIVQLIDWAVDSGMNGAGVAFLATKLAEREYRNEALKLVALMLGNRLRNNPDLLHAQKSL